MSTEPVGPVFDCGKLKELLPDYLDNELQEQICRELRAHLDDCEDCRIFVKTVEITIVLYKHCPDRDMPQEVSIDLRERLRLKLKEGKDC